MFNYEGLTFKFKVNRALTDKEKEHHLLQNERLQSKPLYHARIIRMNSAYLECVDKFFGGKGFMSAAAIVVTGILIWFLYFLTDAAITDANFRNSGYFWYTYVFIPVLCVLLFIYVKVFLKECFTYTHFPIRFNRKTRKVHVFRQDGTVMTEDWDKLYFALCKCRSDLVWEVRGHRMAVDGETVLETFALPYADALVRGTNSTTWSFWEYVRRYMEEPDELPALAGQIKDAPDIADKKESFSEGSDRLMKEMGVLAILILPITLIYILGRVLAIQTSKIPRWPEEIEAECAIEPNDPNVRDAKLIAKPAPEPFKMY